MQKILEPKFDLSQRQTKLLGAIPEIEDLTDRDCERAPTLTNLGVILRTYPKELVDDVKTLERRMLIEAFTVSDLKTLESGDVPHYRYRRLPAGTELLDYTERVKTSRR